MGRRRGRRLQASETLTAAETDTVVEMTYDRRPASHHLIISRRVAERRSNTTWRRCPACHYVVRRYDFYRILCLSRSLARYKKASANENNIRTTSGSIQLNPHAWMQQIDEVTGEMLLNVGRYENSF